MGKTRLNVNERFLKRNLNDNDIVKRDRVVRVENIADNLALKFEAPNSRKFFCKCAWKLSEDEIWTAYEKAHRDGIVAPLKYFIRVCQNKMYR